MRVKRGRASRISDASCKFPTPMRLRWISKPTKTFKDGELLPGGIWVIHLQDQKSPGESALFLQQGKGVLIVGDALIGKPPGALSLLPPEKYADAAKAKAGLRRLLKYQFDAVLVGDGTSILTGAKAAVEQAVV